MSMNKQLLAGDCNKGIQMIDIVAVRIRTFPASTVQCWCVLKCQLTLIACFLWRSSKQNLPYINQTKRWRNIFTTRKRSLGQGNVLHVSFCWPGGVSQHAMGRRVCILACNGRGVYPSMQWGQGICQGVSTTPPGQIPPRRHPPRQTPPGDTPWADTPLGDTHQEMAIFLSFKRFCPHNQSQWPHKSYFSERHHN